MVVGIDLGGTNVRAQAFDDSGGPLGERVEVPSRAQEGTEAITNAIVEAAEFASSGASVAAVGIAVPGHIDSAEGVVRWAPNFGVATAAGFQYWEDVPLGSMLKSRLGVRVVMGNDANCAAMGEYRYGSGRNAASCLVLVTIGTGIGGGVVLGPRALQGRVSEPVVLVGGNQGGAELGHLCIARGGLDCNAGSYGAFEAYCQRDAIIARARHQLRRGRPSQLRDICGGDLALLEPLHLKEAADLGDDVAIGVWDDVGGYLGAGIGSLINVFAPEVFAVGGQIAKAGEWLLGPAVREARNVAIPSLFRDCTIVQAEQLEDAGMLGAAALALGALS